MSTSVSTPVLTPDLTPVSTPPNLESNPSNNNNNRQSAYQNHRVIGQNALEVRQSALETIVFWTQLVTITLEFITISVLMIIAYLQNPQPQTILQWRMSGFGLVTNLLALIISVFPLVYFYRHSRYGLIPTDAEAITFHRMEGVRVLAAYLGIAANTILAFSLFDADVNTQSPLIFWTGLGILLYHVGIFVLPFMALILLLCCLPCWLAILNRLFPEPTRGASAEIIRSLPTFNYDSSREEYGSTIIKKDEDTTCAICLQEYSDGTNLRVLSCRHHYHQKCADEWFKMQATCPLCQRHILDPEPG